MFVQKASITNENEIKPVKWKNTDLCVILPKFEVNLLKKLT